MITAIDSNILIDIFGDDQKFGGVSARALKQCIQEGGICACEIVWIEVAAAFPRQEQFLTAMQTLEVQFSCIGQSTALLASESWRQYRKSGGKSERVVADFLIGAHALQQADRLLTRDRGFYRSYFQALTIYDPTKQ